MAEITNPKHDHGHEHDPHHAAVSHERRDVNVFQITAFGIGLLIGCIVVVFAMWAMFDFLAHREDKKNPALPPTMVRTQQQPPEPRLEVAPKIELKNLVESEELILGSYGLIDPAKGIARIPIDQAIDIVAAKGLPSRPSQAGAENQGFRMIPLDSNGGRTFEKISQ